MFTPASDHNPGEKLANQTSDSGFGGIDPAKIQREFFRAVGNILAATGVNASPWTLEVQKARLLEAIVRQQALAVQQEYGIKLNTWMHRAELQKYAEAQGYLGDANHIFTIEKQLDANTLQGPKLILSAPRLSAATPVRPAEERKEETEMAFRSSAASQSADFKSPTEPVLDYQKILKLMEDYRKEQLAKLEAGEEKPDEVAQRLLPYQKIEQNVKRKAAQQAAESVAKRAMTSAPL